MSPQRRFNGPTLEAVLGKVERELGTNANITSAQKRRSGGVGGFFTKEEFELVVEVGEVGEVGEQDERSNGHSPKSILELAEQINDAEQGTHRVPAISTETPNFAAVFERIASQAEAGPTSKIPASTIPANSNSQGESDIQQASTTPAVSTQASSMKTQRDIRPFVPPTISSPPAPSSIDPPVSSTIDLRSNDLRSNALSAPSSGTDEALVEALLRKGLPKDLIPDGIRRDNAFEVLERRFRSLPVAPAIRSRHGGIVAVVGDRQSATQLARSLADQLNRDPKGVVIASSDRRVRKGTFADIIRTPEDADERRREWRRRNRPTIAVVEAPLAGAGLEWAAEALTALEPTSTWAITSANVKAGDISSWAEALGGLDAIALKNTQETMSPASILSLGIPVNRLDGRRATSSLWAALLTEGLL